MKKTSPIQNGKTEGLKQSFHLGVLLTVLWNNGRLIILNNVWKGVRLLKSPTLPF